MNNRDSHLLIVWTMLFWQDRYNEQYHIKGARPDGTRWAPVQWRRHRRHGLHRLIGNLYCGAWARKSHKAHHFTTIPDIFKILYWYKQNKPTVTHRIHCSIRNDMQSRLYLSTNDGKFKVYPSYRYTYIINMIYIWYMHVWIYMSGIYVL